MNLFERFCLNVRHKHWLEDADWLWDSVRPLYEELVFFLGHHGLGRTINGSDIILVLPRCRWLTEEYEPEMWKHLMSQVQPGDVIADIGAFVGLYSIALAKRVGTNGRIKAFEPDSENFNILKAHVELNDVSEIVELNNVAVGNVDGPVTFAGNLKTQSHINYNGLDSTCLIDCVRMETIFAERRVDIIKIDVEGYEEEVLRGGKKILTEDSLSPRLIYIEVHPSRWPEVGTTSVSLLSLISDCGFKVIDLEGRPVKEISKYGEIIACKNHLEPERD